MAVFGGGFEACALLEVAADEVADGKSIGFLCRRQGKDHGTSGRTLQNDFVGFVVFDDSALDSSGSAVEGFHESSALVGWVESFGVGVDASADFRSHFAQCFRCCGIDGQVELIFGAWQAEGDAVGVFFE